MFKVISNVFHIAFLILAVFPWGLTNAQVYERTGSVLKDGEIIKLATLKNGVYRITPQLLADAGVSISNINPANIHIYGAGGKSLPQKNNIDTPIDPPELSIYVHGEDDGSFDANDYILFYGQAPHYFGPDSVSGTFKLQKNLYSDTTWYFLKIDNMQGKRTEVAPNPGVGFPEITTYDKGFYLEDDLINLRSSGREWFGDQFDKNNPTREYTLDINGISDNSKITIVSSVLGYSFGQSTFSLAADGLTLGDMTVPAVDDYLYAAKGVVVTDTFQYVSALTNGQTLKITLTFGPAPGSRENKGHLDKLIVHTQNMLKNENTPLLFSSFASLANNNSTYRLSGFGTDTKIWDITQPLAPVERELTAGPDAVLFGAPSENLRSYVAFGPSMELPAPIVIGRVENQDIKDTEVPDMLIVSYKGFLSASENLANFRRTSNNLDIKVVTTEEIFNEFSSGSRDVTAIRNYVRYLYHRSDNPKKLKYLLLMGRGSFDHRDIKGRGLNFVPIYQSRNSIHPLYTYGSDDYLGFLDWGEGEWEETAAGDHDMEISVGRFPVKTIEEANTLVDKVISYEQNKMFGTWKNKVVMVADDGDFNIHHQQVDQLVQYLDTAFSGVNAQRLYLDNFKQEAGTGGGEKSPEMYGAISRSIKEGSLIVNYTGHGNTSIWAEETILDQFMIDGWENYDNMPLFVTATCDFGKHDNPDIISTGEKIVLHPKGGSIGLVTTSRPVLSSSNFILNKAFYGNVFKRTKGKMPSLGEIFRNTKNQSLNGVNNRNFSLLGDPSMRLAFPEYDIELVAINNNGNTVYDTINALEYITISGQITDGTGNLAPGFNGEVEVSLYDKQKDLKTLGNENQPFPYREWSSRLFNGRASVIDGKFELSFVIPKNIMYQHGAGRLAMYAWDNSLGLEAAGSSQDLTVGGNANVVSNDRVGPKANVYINDSTFINGGTTSPDLDLLVYLFDENGINISASGVGQDIVGVLDGDQRFVLNDYYTANKDDFTSGKVIFPLYGLEEGPHYMEVRAWDTHNNSVTVGVDFVVVNDKIIAIKDLKGSPNPFTTGTTISFEHSRAGDDLEVYLSIFNSVGKHVFQKKSVIYDSPSRVSFRSWNGLSGGNSDLVQGVYFASIMVRSLKDGAKNNGVCKIIYLN